MWQINFILSLKDRLWFTEIKNPNNYKKILKMNNPKRNKIQNSNSKSYQFLSLWFEKKLNLLYY